ncbi:MAG: glycosyltransferase family 2 protein, partial [Patescibacteria group bacterium]
DFLKKLIEAGEKDKLYGVLGPVIYCVDEPEKIWFAGGRFNRLKTRGSHILSKPDEELKKVDYITGCCLLVKKEVIEKIGLLNKDYFLYYEDGDWCLRAKKTGYLSGLVGSAKIYHKQSRSTQEFSYPYVYYHSRNGLIFGERFGSKLTVYFLSFWIFLKQVAKLAVGYKRNWARPVLRGVWDFWVGKKGKLEGYY